MTPEEKVALLKEAGVWDVIGYPTCIDKLIDLIAAHEREKQAEQEPAELKKCRHCGFLCKPNQNESKKFYPLEQPVAQEPVAYVYEKDVAGIGMRKDVAFTKHVEVGTDLYAAPVRTKDLTDEELNAMWYGNTKDGWLGLFRAVIAADRELNK